MKRTSREEPKTVIKFELFETRNESRQVCETGEAKKYPNETYRLRFILSPAR